MALPPLTTSYAYLRGGCGGFDGETTCSKGRGHDGGCRLRDPNGTARWREVDDDGVELARGPLSDARWMAESPLRRREHPFEDIARAVLEPRDRCQACGLVRAALQHHAAELAAGRDWQEHRAGPLQPDWSEQLVGGEAPPRGRPLIEVLCCDGAVAGADHTAECRRPSAPAGFRALRDRHGIPVPVRDCCGSRLYQPHLPGCGGSQAPLRIRAGAAQLPDRGRCGAQIGGLAGGAPAVCALPARHDGWHRADDGAEWTSTGATRPVRLRADGRLILDEDGTQLGMLDTPELAAAMVDAYNAAAGAREVVEGLGR